MSNQFDPEIMGAARAIAVRAGAIHRFATLGSTSRTDDQGRSDAGSMAELVESARRLVADDDALDRFDDDGGLR